MIQYLSDDIQQPLHVVDFELENEQSRVSLSWHLTPREKKSIIEAMNSPINKKSLAQLNGIVNLEKVEE